MLELVAWTSVNIEGSYVWAASHVCEIILGCNACYAAPEMTPHSVSPLCQSYWETQMGIRFRILIFQDPNPVPSVCVSFPFLSWFYFCVCAIFLFLLAWSCPVHIFPLSSMNVAAFPSTTECTILCFLCTRVTSSSLIRYAGSLAWEECLASWLYMTIMPLGSRNISAPP